MGILIEHETRDAKFDRQYVLKVKTDIDKQLLDKSEIRSAIQTLSPFEAIALDSSGLIWSQQLHSIDQFDEIAVSSRTGQVLELAKVILANLDPKWK